MRLIPLMPMALSSHLQGCLPESIFSLTPSTTPSTTPLTAPSPTLAPTQPTPAPAPTQNPTPPIGHCLPHEKCGAGDCCALGSSCSTCPNDYEANTDDCLWKGAYRCIVPLRTPSPTPPTPIQPCAAPSPTPNTCSMDDLDKMWAAGSGTRDGSFPKTAADCGKESYTVIPLRFKPGQFTSCFSKKLSLTRPCAECFSDASQYGFDNCKSACMTSWSSSGCLKCNDAYKPTLQACVGGNFPTTDTSKKRVVTTGSSTLAPTEPCIHPPTTPPTPLSCSWPTSFPISVVVISLMPFWSA